MNLNARSTAIVCNASVSYVRNIWSKEGMFIREYKNNLELWN